MIHPLVKIFNFWTFAEELNTLRGSVYQIIRTGTDIEAGFPAGTGFSRLSDWFLILFVQFFLLSFLFSAYRKISRI